jgi:hypothetical protein
MRLKNLQPWMFDIGFCLILWVLCLWVLCTLAK